MAEDYRKLLARLGIIPRETFIHGLIGRIMRCDICPWFLVSTVFSCPQDNAKR